MVYLIMLLGREERDRKGLLHVVDIVHLVSSSRDLHGNCTGVFVFVLVGVFCKFSYLVSHYLVHGLSHYAFRERREGS